jgi:hypothetical protein
MLSIRTLYHDFSPSIVERICLDILTKKEANYKRQQAKSLLLF